MKKATDYQALSDRYDQLIASGYQDKQLTPGEFKQSLADARVQHDATLKDLLANYSLEHELEERLRDMHYHAQLGTAAFSEQSANQAKVKPGTVPWGEELIIKAIVLTLMVAEPAGPWNAVSARKFAGMVCETIAYAGLCDANHEPSERTIQRKLRNHLIRSRAVQRYEALADGLH